MDIISDRIIDDKWGKKHNPFCDIVNVKFVTQNGANCIGEFSVHKFFLLQCEYFKIMLEGGWITDTAEEKTAEIEFLDNSWYSVPSATVFIGCLYSSNPKKLIASQSLRTCIEVHKLLDFFGFEFLRTLCSKIIVSKIQEEEDYRLLLKYTNEISISDKILEKSIRNWSAWKKISHLSKLEYPNVISETTFSTGFELVYVLNPKTHSLNLGKSVQKKFTCFEIEWLFEILSIPQKSTNVSLSIQGEHLSKYEVRFKFDICGKMVFSSFYKTMWLISGDPKTNLCTIPKVDGSDAFHSQSDFLVPVFLFVEVIQVVHPLDFTFHNY